MATAQSQGSILGLVSFTCVECRACPKFDNSRISPQFHVVFDNWFETIATDDEETIPETWDILVLNSQFESNIDLDDGGHSGLADEWLSKEELLERRVSQEQRKSRHAGGGRKPTTSDQQPPTILPIDQIDDQQGSGLQRESNEHTFNSRNGATIPEIPTTLEIPTQ